jgi:hypothetical protein
MAMTLGARPTSAGVRFYDPTTGQFLTRDPAVSMTRDAYGYAGNSPLNYTDPTGLWLWDGVCIDINNPDCESIAEQHPEAAQTTANVAGGVLDGVTFGNGNEITGGLGIEDRVRWDSGATTFGRGVGITFNLYGAAAGGWVFTGLQAAGSIEATAQACWGGFNANCATSGAIAVASVLLPFGAGRGAAALGFDEFMIQYAKGYASWGTDAAGIFRDMMADAYC